MDTTLTRGPWRRWLAAAAVCAGSLTAAFAQPATVELAGIKFAPTLPVAGSTLVLNGAGIRYKLIFKVYAAGLYLAHKAATPEAVLDQPGPKRMQVVMLREIDANELGRLFTHGMEENSTPADFIKTIPGTLRMAEIFSARRRLVAGDSFAVEWVPGAGTTVLVNGQPQGEPIKEPEFFRALMRIWLGPHPADRLLKSALLGGSNAVSGSGPGQ